MGGAAIETVLVIGYGTMGRGVLRSFAANGFVTTISSSRPAAQLTDLPPGCAVVGPELSGTSPDLIVENIPEDMALKVSPAATRRAAMRAVCPAAGLVADPVNDGCHNDRSSSCWPRSRRPGRGLTARSLPPTPPPSQSTHSPLR
eukprot:COSAG05_NODE_2666_length_2784_cov_2.315829_4_plen_145_part_00